MTLPADLPAGFQGGFADHAQALLKISRSLVAAAQPEEQLKTPRQGLPRASLASAPRRSCAPRTTVPLAFRPASRHSIPATRNAEDATRRLAAGVAMAIGCHAGFVRKCLARMDEVVR
jgi:hypothetical protein